DLEPTANYIIERLHKVKKIHSVRYRLKSPDSLIAKIIRKKIGDKRRRITLDNYKSEITDLIGIRVLHLFKEDWLDIHHFIKSTWSLRERPIAYVREGDKNEKYEKTDCDVRKHPYGYRSVHYLLKSSPTIKENFSEIQVRTIFEEGWSEIDHTVRYPRNLSDPILVQFSQILNRLAGSADEMGSYVIFLTNQLEKFSTERKSITQKKNELISKLKKQIEDLKINPRKKITFENDLQNLVKMNSRDYGLSTSKSEKDYFLEFLSLPSKSETTNQNTLFEDSNEYLHSIGDNILQLKEKHSISEIMKKHSKEKVKPQKKK
ncbi:MAG: hypothetical protein A2299_04370, partial [Stygiobacter sp. RIFOXYB2_FULL_37_11]